MKQLLTEKLLATGEEDRKLAIERGDFHQGVPAITIVVDGGWPKRCHKHSYNAKSGVAVIFGQRIYLLMFVTSTVLFVTFLRSRRRNHQNTGATATGPAHPQARRAILCLRAFDSLSKPTA